MIGRVRSAGTLTAPLTDRRCVLFVTWRGVAGGGATTPSQRGAERFVFEDGRGTRALVDDRYLDIHLESDTERPDGTNEGAVVEGDLVVVIGVVTALPAPEAPYRGAAGLEYRFEAGAAGPVLVSARPEDVFGKWWAPRHRCQVARL